MSCHSLAGFCWKTFLSIASILKNEYGFTLYDFRPEFNAPKRQKKHLPEKTFALLLGDYYEFESQ